MKNVVIFASGAGTNAQKIIEHFRHSPIGRVSLIVCNKPGAGVLEIAAREHIPTRLIDRESFFRTDQLIQELEDLPTDLIVLAGFLWKIPDYLIRAFPRRIINIHPALLPSYGGKGMYGARVHEAVLASGDVQSGITVHYVNGQYDDGEIILQKSCSILKDDSPEELAQKVHQLEYQWYPYIVEQLLKNMQD